MSLITKTFVFNKEISEKSSSIIIRILHFISENPAKNLQLDFSSVEEISPAGYAMLACIFDAAIELQKNNKLGGKR